MSYFTPRERQIIMMLRDPAACDGSMDGGRNCPGPNALERISELAMLVREIRLGLHAPDSAFASMDECAVMGGLNAFQRPSVRCRWETDQPLSATMKRCADALADDGWKLPPWLPLIYLFAIMPAPFPAGAALT